MEENSEQKHECKFCGKSFPCGRSLGGHMRSHVINNSTQTDEQLEVKNLSSLNNGYCLRDNPRKTWRAADISVEVFLQDKSCKECGKGFRSWKALYGHMKCHSDKQRVASNLEEHQDSWTDENSNQKQLILDRQSDNELSAPNRRKRSERRTMCTATATSAFSLADPASSVSESKHEQEEVALSLIMLSKDVGSWGVLNSVTESSENDSTSFKARANLFNQIKHKETTSEIATPIEQQDEKGKIGNSGFVEKQQGIHSETSASEFSRTINKLKRTRVSVNGFLDRLKNSRADYQCQTQEDEQELGNFKLSGKGYSSIKRKFSDLYDSKVRKSNPLKQAATKVSEDEFCSKRSKFECTTCNKVFSSYQALGGHRASHRRNVACTVSRIESSEKSTETDLTPEQTDDSKVIELNKKESLINHENLVSGFDHEGHTITRGLKKNNGHECPICFKVFTSGQALGGHKRSHLIANSDNRNCETLMISKPVSEIRDFLDLNIPASAEEDSNSQVSSYSPPWWVSTSSALS